MTRRERPFTCRQCGLTFSSRIRDPKYCSPACYHISLTGRRTPAEQRFWLKVKRTDGEGCWNWTGGTSSHGYGIFWNEGRLVGAHRFSWESVNGPMPDGSFLCHRCDNPSCVRPDHCFIGTAAENSADMRGKSRQAQGERTNMATLSAHQVRAIRDLYATGDHTQRALADRFGVKQQAISKVIRRTRWSHLP